MSETRGGRVAIIGAGPAGLTAAYLLRKDGRFGATVFEKHPSLVGGISRTESYNGYLFDIGGHRFFSKSQEVEDFWTEILGDELLVRPRKSRIYYDDKFFDYPLVARDALRKLGVVEAAKCVMSYLEARANPIPNPVNLEDWVINQFGERLYRIFFKTYTEKVWGIPCDQISADWAAQRIKGLSLSEAIKNAVFPQSKEKPGGEVIKTLIEEFRYPKYGPGQMWETTRQKAAKMGAEILMDTTVTKIQRVSSGKWLITLANGKTVGFFDYVISSAPLRELIQSIENPIEPKALKAAGDLKYRDFLTVVLMMPDKKVFDDNWIYIHDPGVKVGRIQNFKSWSPYMVPDENMACYGLEYFCFEGDGLWDSADEDLIKLGAAEMEKIGLCKKEDVVDGHVVRQPKAYPVYDFDYQQNVEIIRKALEPLTGLILVGRNGMHKYNNQDHSMMTAMLAVENIKAGKEVYNLWQVNQDAEYHESGDPGKGGRRVPGKIES